MRGAKGDLRGEGAGIGERELELENYFTRIVV